MPALVKVKLNVAPLPPSEWLKAPVSLVTVCGALLVLVQVTVVPTLMVSTLGLKLKPPYPPTTETAACEPLGVFVAAEMVLVGVTVAATLGATVGTMLAAGTAFVVVELPQRQPAPAAQGRQA